MINRRIGKGGAVALGLLLGIGLAVRGTNRESKPYSLPEAAGYSEAYENTGFSILPEAFAQQAERKGPEVRLGYGHNPQGSSPYRSVQQLPITQHGGRQNIYAPGYFPNAVYPYPYGFPVQGGFYGRGIQASGVIGWTSYPRADELRFTEESVEADVERWADDIEAHAGRGIYGKHVYLHDLGEPVDFLFYKTNGNIKTNIFAIIVVDKIGQELKGIYPKKKLDKNTIDKMRQSLGQKGVPLYILEANKLDPSRLRDALAYFSSQVMPHVIVRKHGPYVFEVTDEGPERGSQKRLIIP